MDGYGVTTKAEETLRPRKAGGYAAIIDAVESRTLGLPRAIDGCIIVLALWISCGIAEKPWPAQYTWLAMLAVGIYQVLAEFLNVYRSWHDFFVKRECTGVVLAWLGTAAALLAGAYIGKVSADYSRKVMLTWLFLAPAGMICVRMVRAALILHLHTRYKSGKRAIIIGATDLGKRLAEAIKSTPAVGMALCGFYDDRNGRYGGSWTVLDDSVSGDVELAVKEARARRVDVVYIALPLSAEGRILHLIERFSDTTAAVYIVPDVSSYRPLSARWMSLRGIPLVSVHETPHSGIDALAKRIEDIVISALVLMVIALPMLLIALAIKMTSPGPVIFRQRRYGLRGEEIEVWKFRSMTVCEDGGEIVQATRNDARVTRLGAFLRRTSLDELPQFINVLMGRMSIVGPRPHAVAHNEMYRTLIKGYMLRHQVKPGITGLAQVNGFRGETRELEKMEGRVSYDLEYIRSWSVRLDIEIMLKTIFVLLFPKDVY